MNNIDYRFYNPDMREMHSMKGYDNGKITFEITEPSVIAQNNDIFPIKDIILMQYTGFRDKNGRKIYDGDILKSTFDKIEIKYHDGCFWTYDSDGYAYTIENLGLDDGFKLYEVVGCIHYTDEDMVSDYNEYYE